MYDRESWLDQIVFMRLSVQLQKVVRGFYRLLWERFYSLLLRFKRVDIGRGVIYIVFDFVSECKRIFYFIQFIFDVCNNILEENISNWLIMIIFVGRDQGIQIRKVIVYVFVQVVII